MFSSDQINAVILRRIVDFQNSANAKRSNKFKGFLLIILKASPNKCKSL